MTNIFRSSTKDMEKGHCHGGIWNGYISVISHYNLISLTLCCVKATLVFFSLGICDHINKKNLIGVSIRFFFFFYGKLSHESLVILKEMCEAAHLT